MTTQLNLPGLPPATGARAPEIVRLWKDEDRLEQIARISGLHLQVCDREGREIWEEANRLHAQLPEGIRIDLPSPRVLARVLGFYRSVAMLKYRPMLDLQLSVEDIARVVGYSKSVVEAALRWLGSDPIIHRGQLVSRGLGYITRVRRKAKAIVQGVLKSVYRTSETALSRIGRGILEVADICEKAGQAMVSSHQWDKRQSRRKKDSTPPQDRPQQDCPQPEAPDRRWDVGLATAQEALAWLDPEHARKKQQQANRSAAKTAGIPATDSG